MTKTTLTDLEIRKLRAPTDGRLEIADGKLPGLSVRITKNGVKTFALRTRIDGKLVRVSLGRYPDLSLSEARGIAHQMIGDAKAGREIQPKKHKKEVKYQFDHVLSEYLTQHGRRYFKESTYNETHRILNVEFIPNWGSRDIRKITKQDVVAITNDIFNRPQLDAKNRVVKEESPSAANHAFTAIRAFFGWCVGQGKIEISPCIGLRSPAPNRKRDRTLADGELASVWRAAQTMGYPYGHIIRLLIATVQRRSEVVGLRWDMLDLEKCLWRVPASENKSGREYLVPLSEVALEIINDVPHLDERLMFPALRSDGKIFSAWSKNKTQIDKLCGVTGWTVHDLRRTGSTNLGRLAVRPHVKERVLNHLTGELGGVAGVYDVYSYLPEKRDALDLWANHIRAILDTSEQPQQLIKANM